jgi:hypothetical protein
MSSGKNHHWTAVAKAVVGEFHSLHKKASAEFDKHNRPDSPTECKVTMQHLGLALKGASDSQVGTNLSNVKDVATAHSYAGVFEGALDSVNKFCTPSSKNMG